MIWYAARVRADRLDKATEDLEDRGYRTVVPMRQVARKPSRFSKSKARLEVVSIPAISGLVFVISELPITAADVWRIEQSPWEYLTHFYGSGDDPTPISRSEIALMEQVSDEIALAAAEMAAGKRDAIPAGKVVQIKEGPLAGFSGTVEGDLGNAISIWVHMMGQQTRATVSLDALELAE